jgi:hypothetical protein
MTEYFQLFVIIGVAFCLLGFLVWIAAWMFIASMFSPAFSLFASKPPVE